ncbi:MAG: protein phosphatase 2C domain-containing protein [Anaerolineae bacterium]|nr:protein phosphatase 2C domain-containing protein [Anaerolineae bacterium]
MRPKIQLLVDPVGWPTPLVPDMVLVVLEARLPAYVSAEIDALEMRDRWFEALPRGETVMFLFLTRPLPPDWEEPLRYWLNSSHRLYLLHTDGADQKDMRALAQMTVTQPVARAPYRIVQQNATGLDKAADWMSSILKKLVDFEPEPPPIKITPTRWRSLPSNRQDEHAYPDQVTLSVAGAGGYAMTAASTRGKSHAHTGVFRDDAVGLAATSYWNLMAVADGAGTAPLARVGSNLAVTAAIRAMQEASPPLPAAEDIAKTIWAGLKASYNALIKFASERSIDVSNLNTTLQVLLHWPQKEGCLIGVAHIGDGLVVAEGKGQIYPLTEPDVDPDDAGRTLFLTSGPLRQWMEERTKIYQFDEPLNIIALMTDGVSSDLEPYDELLPTNLFDALGQRVLCYPLKQREQALLAFISYERRGSFDDRTLAILARE